MSSRVDEERWCALECECGVKGGQYCRHYGLVRCSCGRVYWALQRKRGGAFELVLWPGDFRTPPPAINGEVARIWHREHGTGVEQQRR